MKTWVAIGLGAGLIATGGPGFANGQSASSGDVATPRPTAPLGDVHPDCGTSSVAAQCTFKPGETRKYTLDVLSTTCDPADITFEGIEAGRVIPEAIWYGQNLCRIGSAKASFKKDQEVTFRVRAKFRGRPVGISIRVRK